MTVIDFHGNLVEEAYTIIHSEMGYCRGAGGKHEYQFITGYGIMRTNVMEMLKGFDIECSYKIGNPGTIIAIIE